MASDSKFPTLPGLGWDVSRTPTMRTEVKESLSGRETRLKYWSAPIWELTLKYDVLRETGALTELRQLVGFFLLRGGRFESFLYTDPFDNAVTAQPIGVGNGVNKDFQLLRSFGSYSEPVMWPETIINVFVNGVSVPFTLGQFGVVTLDTAPAHGATVSWSGSFNYRARFSEDTTEYTEFCHRLFEMQSVSLRACLGDKL